MVIDKKSRKCRQKIGKTVLDTQIFIFSIANVFVGSERFFETNYFWMLRSILFLNNLKNACIRLKKIESSTKFHYENHAGQIIIGS